MEWTEDPQLADRLLELIEADMRKDKPLPHVTELIYCLTRSYNDRFDHIPLSPKEVTLFSIGVNLEKTFLQGLRQQKGGVCEDIHYSIDFLNIDERIGELKSTRISPNKHPRDFPTTWNRQLLAYMYTQGTQRAVYAVIHLLAPVFKVWEVYAPHEEVHANWTWLQARRAVYMHHIENRILPTPFEHNEGWECKNCRYKLVCDAEMADREMRPGVADDDRAQAEESAQQETSHDG